MSESCFICDKHAGRIQTAGVTIFEDKYVYVGHIDRQGKPNYLGHIMVDLKRHVPTLADLTFDEAQAFGVAIARVSRALKEVVQAEHIYALVSGNSVPHLHIHLVARYPNTPREFWGPNEVYDWEQAPMGDNQQVIKLCEKLKVVLDQEVD